MAAPQVQKMSQKFLRLKSHFFAIKNAKGRCFFIKRPFLFINPPKLPSKDIKMCVNLRKLALGPSLALLGFSIWKEEEELSEHDQIRQIISKGIVAKENGNISEASKAYHEALSKSTDFLNDKKISQVDHMNHRVFIYDYIANLSMDIGDLQTAEAVFKDTMKLALQLGMAENDNAMIEMSLKLATIYLYTGRIKLAVVGLQHCITEQETKLQEKPKAVSDDKPVNAAEQKEQEENTKVLLGKALKHLAHYHIQQRDFKKAESLMQKSLEISQSVLGSSHDNTFAIMNDIATCQMMLEEYEKAESILHEGIKLSGRAKSLMQSAMLSNLGALYIRTKRFDKAKSACERGLKIAEKGNDEFLKKPCQACLSRLEELKNAEQKGQ